LQQCKTQLAPTHQGSCFWVHWDGRIEPLALAKPEAPGLSQVSQLGVSAVGTTVAASGSRRGK
jgi:hypothetical protein